MRVLVLRPEPGASATAARLHELGHEPILSPVATVTPTDGPLPAGPFAAIVVTSRNALPAIMAARDILGETPAFAVGERTAEALRQAGFLVPEFAPDAAALADVIRTKLAPARLLHAGGRHRKSEPSATLGRVGFDVVSWTVYDAEPARRLSDEACLTLHSGEADAALHFSARTARLALAFADEAGLLPTFAGIRHYCLSPDVARELESLATRIHVAGRPDEGTLLALLGQAGRARAPSDLDAMDGTNGTRRS